jgi:hypothetical protein
LSKFGDADFAAAMPIGDGAAVAARDVVAARGGFAACVVSARAGVDDFGSADEAGEGVEGAATGEAEASVPAAGAGLAAARTTAGGGPPPCFFFR